MTNSFELGAAELVDREDELGMGVVHARQRRAFPHRILTLSQDADPLHYC
jgi:hypothetical protein